MVAASKMRKAQQAAIAAAPFARRLYRIQRSATTRIGRLSAPAARGAATCASAAVILVAGDKGLCGALNTNVFRLAAQFDPSSRPSSSPPDGRRRSSSARSGRTLAAEFAYGDSPTFAEARAIAAFARDLFLNGEVDEVHDRRPRASSTR